MNRAISIIIFFIFSFSLHSQSHYVVKVDNLRVRNKPVLSSQTVYMLEEGTVIESTGNVSNLKEEVELRGIIYRAPFYEIEFADDRLGWIYGAAVQQVSSVHLTTKAKSELSEFYKYLVQLGYQSPDNGGKAYQYFNIVIKEMDVDATTAAAIILENYLITLSEELYELLSDLPYPDMSIDRFLESEEPIFNRLRTNGLKPVAMEGSFYPVVDYRHLQKATSGKTTLNYQDYLSRVISDKRVTLEGDGAIIIPIEDVAARAMKWKNFNDLYPDFPMHEKTDAIEKNYMLLVFTGMDNSPVFDWEGMVEERFMNAWKNIIKDYPDTEFASDLTSYVSMIQSNHGKKPSGLEAILKKYYFDYMLMY